MKKLLLTLVVAGMCFGMVGCGPFQNVNMEDVRNDEHFRKDGVIPMSIERIDFCLKQYNYKCTPTLIPTINPENGKEAHLVTYVMGWTQYNPYLIIDLYEQENKQTYYKGYTFISTWDSAIDKIINQAIDCGQCKY